MAKKTTTPTTRVIYTIEEIQNPDGTTGLRRVNHGIDAHRLHSILMFATNAVAAQISRDMPPPERVYMDTKKKP